jgi:hypothetical protein
MIIETKTKPVEVTSVISTTINQNGKKYPALKFIFPGAITEEDIDALLSGEITIDKYHHDGYNTQGEVSVIIGKVTTVEEERDNLQSELSELSAEYDEMQENVNVILPVLDDATALIVKSLYPSFDEIIGMTVKQGFRFVYGGKLFKTVQPETTIQAHQTPGKGTESLYTEICETHAGTADDPIPYSGNMVLENGKYYTQDGVIYYCNRDTVNPVYNPLSELVGLYVEVYTA